MHQKVQQTNIPVIPSTGVNTSTEASGSKPRSNTKKNRILPAKRENKKKVEDHLRTNKSVWTKVNRVDSSISYKRVVINSNSESVCKMCNKCLNSANHEMCVVNILISVNATPIVKSCLEVKGKQIGYQYGKLFLITSFVQDPRGFGKQRAILFANIGYQWRPTGKKFTLGKLDYGYQWRPTGKKFALGEMCPLTKLSVVQVILWYLDSGCSKHMTGNHSKLKNFVGKSSIGSVDSGMIIRCFHGLWRLCYWIDVLSNSVYTTEGLGLNLFSVGQFCDSDLEVAFRKHTCFVRDINGADLLKEGRAIESTTRELVKLMETMQSHSMECIRTMAPVNSSCCPPGYIFVYNVAQVAPSMECLHHQLRTCIIRQHQEPGSAQSSSGNVNLTEPNQVTQPPDHLREWTKDHHLDNIVGNHSPSCIYQKQLDSMLLW
ncbi:hypothetical protein Tco_0378188 [Tanacetum coccineum]